MRQTLDHLAHRELARRARDFRNLSRAGVAKNRSRTSTRVPTAPGRGRWRRRPPGLDARARTRCPGPRGRLVRRSRLTPASAASASPRKPEAGDPDQLVVVELGGGMALDRQRQLLGRHAAAVVGHGDQRAAAPRSARCDARRAGIERVLDQLLDHRGRPLDHLAGSDPVDHARWQTSGWQARLSRMAARMTPAACLPGRPRQDAAGRPCARPERRCAQPSRPVGAPTTTIRRRPDGTGAGATRRTSSSVTASM